MGTRISLSKQLGISVSTVITIVKNCNIIEGNANQCWPMQKKRKYIKKSRFEKLEDILKEWFENATNAKSPSKWCHPSGEGSAHCQKITNRKSAKYQVILEDCKHNL
jgi:hypothetical protein